MQAWLIESAFIQYQLYAFKNSDKLLRKREKREKRKGKESSEYAQQRKQKWKGSVAKDLEGAN